MLLLLAGIQVTLYLPLRAAICDYICAFYLYNRNEIDYICASICQLLSSVQYLEFIANDVPQALSDHIHQIQQASYVPFLAY